VQFIGKPDCHLCDDARAVVAAVCAELDEPWLERSILDDPALYDEFWERIPVVLVDDRVTGFWRIEAAQLRSALTG
jgi:hypothetical protein